jgi:hypothetical protein
MFMNVVEYNAIVNAYFLNPMHYLVSVPTVDVSFLLMVQIRRCIPTFPLRMEAVEYFQNIQVNSHAKPCHC